MGKELIRVRNVHQGRRGGRRGGLEKGREAGKEREERGENGSLSALFFSETCL